jgi:hypothetical protein
MKPIFAPPPGEIVSIPACRDVFIAFLKAHGVQLDRWHNPEASIEKYVKEIREHDAVYCLVEHKGKVMPARFILTRAIRVMVMYKMTYSTVTERIGFEPSVLIQYKREADGYRRRSHVHTSVSEKIILDPKTGKPMENEAETAWRCIGQETRLWIPPRIIKRGLKFWPTEQLVGEEYRRLVPSAWYVEVDIGEKRNRQNELVEPGMLRMNQIAKYHLRLSDAFCFDAIRYEGNLATRYVAIREESSAASFIPNELILRDV